MMTIVCSWRCKCGARIKAVGESRKHDPMGTSVAECPQCREPQMINCKVIKSVTVEKEESVADSPSK